MYFLLRYENLLDFYFSVLVNGELDRDDIWYEWLCLRLFLIFLLIFILYSLVWFVCFGFYYIGRN